MALVCQNCGTTNTDPGGNPQTLRCGHCGRATLVREPTKQQKVFAAAVAGAALVGMASGNPIGALIGGLVGLYLGEREFK